MRRLLRGSDTSGTWQAAECRSSTSSSCQRTIIAVSARETCSSTATTRTPRRSSTGSRRWGTTRAPTTGWRSWACRCVWTGLARSECVGAASARWGRSSIISPCLRGGSKGSGRGRGAFKGRLLPAKSPGCPASLAGRTSSRSPHLGVPHPGHPHLQPAAPIQSSPAVWPVWRRCVLKNKQTNKTQNKKLQLQS